MKNWKLEPYQGWKNYYTWNIALFLNNDYGLYCAVKEYRDFCARQQVRMSYVGFLLFAGLDNCKTPDGVSFSSRHVCKQEIVNDVLKCD